MRWKHAVVPAAAIVLLPLSSAATPVDLESGVEIYGGDFSAWEVASTGDNCTADPGAEALAIAEGSFQSPAVTDAFDNGHVISVSGTRIDAPTGILTKSSVTAGPVFGPGKVWVTHTALAGKPVVRTVVRLTNPATIPQTHDVVFSSNGGGEGAEGTRGTSDGDSVLEPGDDWIIWSTAGADTDPSKATAFSGNGDVRSQVKTVTHAPGSPAPGGGTDCLTVSLRAKVPAKETRYLIFFTGLDTSDMGASTFTVDYVRSKPYLFKGITDGQRARTLNWRL